MDIKLPRGLSCQKPDIKLGRIIPGTDSDPIITITGRGATIRCRLISFIENKDAFVEDDSYSEGDLSQEEIDAIDSWIENQIPKFISEYGIRHYVRFVSDSNCYYDFSDKTLYGANGEKEGQGPINNSPCKLSYSEAQIVEHMTPASGHPFTCENLVFWCDGRLGKGSVPQTWSRIRKYDSSMGIAFLPKTHGCYYYKGDPPVWEIGEPNNDFTLTFECIFNVLAYGISVATIDLTNRHFYAYKKDNVPLSSVFAFLGLNNAVMDDFFAHIDLQRLFVENFCGQAALMKLLSRFCRNLNAVWNQIGDNIKENLRVSLNSSAYFYEHEKNLPSQFSDLSIYTNTDARLESSLSKVSTKVKDLIEDTEVGSDFFSYCDLSVNPNEVIDSVVDFSVAIILACFCYCRFDGDNSTINLLLSTYKSKLSELIHDHFDFNPPRGRNERDLDTLIAELKERLDAIEDVDLRESKRRKILEEFNLYDNLEFNRTTTHPSGLNL